jgi:hypothetical protein
MIRHFPKDINNVMKYLIYIQYLFYLYSLHNTYVFDRGGNVPVRSEYFFEILGPDRKTEKRPKKDRLLIINKI